MHIIPLWIKQKTGEFFHKAVIRQLKQYQEMAEYGIINQDIDISDKKLLFNPRVD